MLGLSPADILDVARTTPRRAAPITFLSFVLAAGRDFSTNTVDGLSQETLATALEVSKPTLRGHLRELRARGLRRRHHQAQPHRRPRHGPAVIAGWTRRADTYTPGWIPDPQGGAVVPLTPRAQRPLKIPGCWLDEVWASEHRGTAVKAFYQRVLARVQEVVENAPRPVREPFPYKGREPFPSGSRDRTQSRSGYSATGAAAAPAPVENAAAENASAEPGLPFGPIAIVFIDDFAQPNPAPPEAPENVPASEGGLYPLFVDAASSQPEPWPFQGQKTEAHDLLRRFEAVHDEHGKRKAARHDSDVPKAVDLARAHDRDDLYELWLIYFGWEACRDRTYSFAVFHATLARHLDRLAAHRLREAERRREAEARQRAAAARAPAPVVSPVVAVSVLERLGWAVKTMSSSSTGLHEAEVRKQAWTLRREAEQTADRAARRACIDERLAWERTQGAT